MKKLTYLFLALLIFACSSDGDSDVSGDGSSNDTTAPIITLNGQVIATVNLNSTYTDAGATAVDDVDGDLTSSIVTTGEVNTSIEGDYIITYTVSDTSGNTATTTRQVIVFENNTNDTIAPIITLLGDAIVSIIQGTAYTDAGATAVDDVDGDLTSSIVTTGEVNTSIEGDYIITYTVSDTSGNTATASRQVIVTTAENPVFLAENGITIKAKEWAEVGDTGVIDGVTYTVVNSAVLINMVNNGEDLTRLATTKVNYMIGLFEGTLNNPNTFNQDIGNWDVSNVPNMSNMFYEATSFNQDISNWDVSNVNNMNGMFLNADAFNQDISSWDVSNVTTMKDMFMNADFFNQPIGNWDVSSVTNMQRMFLSADRFNQPIGDWDVSNVTSMWSMFCRCSSLTYQVVFNQDLSNWDVSSVTNMAYMFDGSPNFNQPIGNWDVSSVTEMQYMFRNATLFNQNLSSWNVSNINDCENFNINTPQWTLPKPNLDPSCLE